MRGKSSESKEEKIEQKREMKKRHPPIRIKMEKKAGKNAAVKVAIVWPKSSRKLMAKS